MATPEPKTASPTKPGGPQLDIAKYRLSDVESHRIFTNSIMPAEFKGLQRSPTDPPLAILVVGQTGAGKSSLSSWILEAFASNSRKPAHFIADTYKTFHPEYDHLMDESPRLASPATSPDARRWLAMAAREATRRRVDVFLESACREPRDFTELADIFRDAGYRIEVLVLAVPAGLSRLGLLIRYFKRLPEAQSKGLPVRLTPVNIHDASYTGLLDIALYLDKTDIADQVLVVRRGNLVAYTQHKGEFKPGMRPRIAEALARERDRQLSIGDVERAMDEIEFLTQFPKAAAEVNNISDLLKTLGSSRQSNRKTDGEDTDKDGANEVEDFPELLPLQYATMDTAKTMNMGSKVLRMGNLASAD